MYVHSVHNNAFFTGADPGSFVTGRGGVPFPEIFDNPPPQKKGRGEKTERFGYSIPLSLLQKYGLNRLSKQVYCR